VKGRHGIASASGIRASGRDAVAEDVAQRGADIGPRAGIGGEQPVQVRRVEQLARYPVEAVDHRRELDRLLAERHAQSGRRVGRAAHRTVRKIFKREVRAAHLKTMSATSAITMASET
jgi:GTP cyclohydrolase III